MSDVTDLLKLQNANTAMQAAKYGGYGGGSQLGGLFNILARGYQAAFPKAPAANLLVGGMEAANLMNYNKAMQAQYRAEQERQARQRGANAATFGMALGDRAQQIPNIEDLAPEDFAKIAPFIGNRDFGATQNDLNQGKMPVDYGMAPAAQVQQQGQQINQQQSKNAAYSEWQAQQAKKFAEGQGASAINPNKMQGLGSMLPNQGELQMEPSALQAGVSQQVVPTQTISPFMMPAIDPADMNAMFNYGVNDTQEAGKQTETKRSNMVKETQAQKELEAKLKGDYFKKYPPTGGGSNPNEAMLARQAYEQGLMSKEQYIKTFGGSGAASVPSANSMKYLDKLEQDYIKAGKYTGGLFGMGNKEADVAQQNKIAQKYNAIAPAYGLPSLPFGGQSQAKLNNAVQGIKKKYSY